MYSEYGLVTENLKVIGVDSGESFLSLICLFNNLSQLTLASVKLRASVDLKKLPCGLRKFHIEKARSCFSYLGLRSARTPWNLSACPT